MISIIINVVLLHLKDKNFPKYYIVVIDNLFDAHKKIIKK